MLTFVTMHARVLACAVDVTINEGASIEMCASDPLTITALAGFASYDWTGPETLSGQTITPQFSGQYTVTAVDGVGCVSSAVIDVTIHANPVPVILSSEGNPICASSPGTLLSVSQSFASYDWGGGNTGPTFFVPGAGAYSVTVIDANGCQGQGVISITTVQFNLTQTTLEGCYGSTVTLHATGGNSFAWSTGETGSTIVVSPSSTTTYSVTVSNGNCTETLSATVDAIPPYTYELVDTLYMAVDETQLLLAPSGNFTYNWYPTDQIDYPQGASVILTAQYSHTLHMEALHSTGCKIEDSVVVIVIDLEIPGGISPNGDGINDLFVIPQLYSLPGELLIWNRWGDIVFESDAYENNWDGTCQTSLCMGKDVLPQGTYFYSLTVQEVNYTGYITLKL
jgi:gliding motility-associated-like protein